MESGGCEQVDPRPFEDEYAAAGLRQSGDGDGGVEEEQGACWAVFPEEEIERLASCGGRGTGEGCVSNKAPGGARVRTRKSRASTSAMPGSK